MTSPINVRGYGQVRRTGQKQCTTRRASGVWRKTCMTTNQGSACPTPFEAPIALPGCSTSLSSWHHFFSLVAVVIDVPVDAVCERWSCVVTVVCSRRTTCLPDPLHVFLPDALLNFHFLMLPLSANEVTFASKTKPTRRCSVRVELSGSFPP